MARRYFFFTGIAYWAKVHKPDREYGNYTIDLFLDDSSWEKYKESGLQLKIREGNDKTIPGGSFLKFRRDPEKVFENQNGAPTVLIYEDGEYKPFDKPIGNGSIVNCKVEVYDSQKGTGHRLEAVAVENLVEYDDPDDQDMPF